MEKWVDVLGWEESHQISNLGRVKRKKTIWPGTDRNKKPTIKYVKEKILSQNTNKKGYKAVTLCFNGRKKTITVHRLVAIAFCEGYKDDKQVDHLDCNKLNNNPNNLEWVSLEENLKRSHRYGAHSGFIPKLKARKLTVDQVHEIRNIYDLNPLKDRKENVKKPYCQRTIAKMFNVSQDTVKKVINRFGTYKNV